MDKITKQELEIINELPKEEGIEEVQEISFEPLEKQQTIKQYLNIWRVEIFSELNTTPKLIAHLQEITEDENGNILSANNIDNIEQTLENTELSKLVDNIYEQLKNLKEF